MSRTQRDGILLVLLSSVGYALVPIIAKNIYAVSTINAVDVVVWRFIFATPIIWLSILVSRSPAPPIPLPRKRLLALGLLFASAALTAFGGLETVIPASTFTVIFFTYPAFVALISIVMGERLPLVGWVALAMTIPGILLTVPNFADFGDVSDPMLHNGLLLGIVMAILNAIIVAVYFVVLNRVLRGHTAVARASAWSITGTLIIMLFVGLVRGVEIPSNLDTWWNLLALAVLGTVMPIFCINVGIKKLGAARAAIISTVQPLMTMLLAVVLLGEVIGPVQWLGGGIIIASILLLETSRSVRVEKLKVETSVAGD